MTPRAFALSAAGLAVVALLGPSAPAHGHAIESSLERLSGLTDQLVLDSRFGSGEPADDAVVRLVPPGGTPIEVGRTDASGQLRFRLPRGATAAWEVQVDKGPGHRDYLELPGPAASAQPGQAALPSAAPNSSLGLVGLTAIAGTLGGGVLSGTFAWRRRRRRQGGH